MRVMIHTKDLMHAIVNSRDGKYGETRLVSRVAGSPGLPHPYFSPTPTNISVVSGQPAYLPCRVHMLGDRSVTWMRMRDLHILTVALVTYSADERFQILHSDETDDWTLQIQFTQPRDSGAYKCQVNSRHKIARNVYLSVVGEKRSLHFCCEFQ
ncbi:Immunoglobulin V-set domain [Trinorchestia longiramus]|nr:Immunoglobulin V-set domain [Trinorchestia longiramus]